MRVCHCNTLASLVLHWATTFHMIPTTEPSPQSPANREHLTMATIRLVTLWRVLIITGSGSQILYCGKMIQITLLFLPNDNLIQVSKKHADLLWSGPQFTRKQCFMTLLNSSGIIFLPIAVGLVTGMALLSSVLLFVRHPMLSL